MEKLKPMDEKMEKQVQMVLNMDGDDDESEQADEEMIPDEESEMMSEEVS